MGKIRFTVSLVLVLYDELTGRPVNRNIFTVVNQYGIRAVYKDNGIYVFTEDHGMVEVTITGRGYQDKKLTIQEDAKNNVQRIWLMPSVTNEALSQAAVLMGTVSPKEEIRILTEKTELPYRLLQKVRTGDKAVKMYHFPYDDIQGRNFRIKDTEKGTYEDIELDEEKEDCCFTVKEPVKMVHHPESSSIYRMTVVHADGEGKFLAAIRGIPKSGSRCIIEAEGIVKEVDLKYRQIHLYEGIHKGKERRIK